MSAEHVSLTDDVVAAHLELAAADEGARAGALDRRIGIERRSAAQDREHREVTEREAAVHQRASLELKHFGACNLDHAIRGAPELGAELEAVADLHPAPLDVESGRAVARDRGAAARRRDERAARV